MLDDKTGFPGAVAAATSRARLAIANFAQNSIMSTSESTSKATPMLLTFALGIARSVFSSANLAQILPIPRSRDALS
jgi:hypothetical protein